jgi:hypothetical protein
VYAWTPTGSGVITVELGHNAAQQPACATDIMSPYCWDGVLYLLRWTGSAWAPTPYVTSGDRACSDVTGIGLEHVQAHVVAGTYAIVIDGYNSEPWSQGPYNLRIDLQ